MSGVRRGCVETLEPSGAWEKGGLDFSRPFLPESLARVSILESLSDGERRALNQIRGLEYLYILGMAERVAGRKLDSAPVLADFAEALGAHCETVGAPEEIAARVLEHDPLAVALALSHVDWMTERHCIAAVREENELDPGFRSLLESYWSLDLRIEPRRIEPLGRGLQEPEIREAVEEYLDIASLLDRGLSRQLELDLDCLERAVGRRLGEEERKTITTVQRRAQRWTFLGSAMTHPGFLAVVERLSSGARKRVDEIAPAFQ